MKSLSYAALGSVCALVIGILLVIWPEAAIIYLVITVGVLFLLPGLMGLLSYVFIGAGIPKWREHFLL